MARRRLVGRPPAGAPDDRARAGSTPAGQVRTGPDQAFLIEAAVAGAPATAVVLAGLRLAAPRVRALPPTPGASRARPGPAPAGDRPGNEVIGDALAGATTTESAIAGWGRVARLVPAAPGLQGPAVSGIGLALRELPAGRAAPPAPRGGGGVAGPGVLTPAAQALRERREFELARTCHPGTLQQVRRANAQSTEHAPQVLAR